MDSLGLYLRGEGIQYLLYSPVEGLLNITTKFTTDTPKTITPFDPIFLQNIVNRKYFYSSAAQKSN